MNCIWNVTCGWSVVITEILENVFCRFGFSSSGFSRHDDRLWLLQDFHVSECLDERLNQTCYTCKCFLPTKNKFLQFLLVEHRSWNHFLVPHPTPKSAPKDEPASYELRCIWQYSGSFGLDFGLKLDFMVAWFPKVRVQSDNKLVPCCVHDCQSPIYLHCSLPPTSFASLIPSLATLWQLKIGIS